MRQAGLKHCGRIRLDWIVFAACLGGAAVAVWRLSEPRAPATTQESSVDTALRAGACTRPRGPVDDSGYSVALEQMPLFDPTSLESMREAFHDIGYRNLAKYEQQLGDPALPAEGQVRRWWPKRCCTFTRASRAAPTTCWSGPARWSKPTERWRHGGCRRSSSCRAWPGCAAARRRIASFAAGTARAFSRFGRKRSTRSRPARGWR